MLVLVPVLLCVQAVCRQHSSVLDVSVVGVNDAVLGEVLCALVMRRCPDKEDSQHPPSTADLEETAESIRDMCRQDLVGTCRTHTHTLPLPSHIFGMVPPLY